MIDRSSPSGPLTGFGAGDAINAYDGSASPASGAVIPTGLLVGPTQMILSTGIVTVAESLLVMCQLFTRSDVAAVVGLFLTYEVGADGEITFCKGSSRTTTTNTNVSISVLNYLTFDADVSNVTIRAYWSASVGGAVLTLQGGEEPSTLIYQRIPRIIKRPAP